MLSFVLSKDVSQCVMSLATLILISFLHDGIHRYCIRVHYKSQVCPRKNKRKPWVLGPSPYDIYRALEFRLQMRISIFMGEKQA